MTVNQYIFDSKRTRCPFCGSSDGFARVLNPDTKTPVGESIGKCHSCNVFRLQNQSGFVTDAGELVASREPVAPKYFDLTSLAQFGLKPERSNLVQYIDGVTGSDNGQRIASQMLVVGDMWGNTSFVYADIQQRGTSIKTICYGVNAKRSKDGVKAGGRQLDTSQIAGYVSPEGQPRFVRVQDGAYQFLYNQHSLARTDAYDATVLVESEKTAYFATVMCDLLGIRLTFLAAGGTNGLSTGKIGALSKLGAIPAEAIAALQQKPVLICFDADDPGEKGSNVAREALDSVGCQPVVYNMRSVFNDIALSTPVPEQQNADIADVIVYAMEHGEMFDEIERLLKGIYNKALGIVDIQSAIAKSELSKLTKADYHREAPQASLTFTDPVTHKTSQLAIPGNIVMLLASPGVGKSSVISSIVARHVSPVTNAFGLDIHAPKGLVVIDTEQPKDQVIALHKRLAKRIGCNPDELPEMFDHSAVNWYVSDKRLSEERQVDNLFAAVAEANPSFVIVDQVGSLVKNVNSNDETKALIRRIATDAESALRTWIVVLHTNPTSDKGRGVLGSDIHRWAASVLFIRKPAESGDPSLLTTSNIDGTMAKVRSGPPVRCFFAWDEEQGDFYPTTKVESGVPDMAIIRSAIDEAFDATQGMARPLMLTELRTRLREILGAEDGKRVFAYIMKNHYVKRTNLGKLWPNYEKLQE